MDTERFQRAMTLRDSGQIHEALRELCSLSEETEDPGEKASLLLNESRCLVQLGDLEGARKRLEEAAAISPRTQGRLYVAFQQAMLQWHEGKPSQALKTLEGLLKHYLGLLKTAEHQGLYEDVQINRGILLTQLDRFGEARVVLEECLSYELRPEDHASVLFNLGLCYLKLGDSVQAKRKLLESLTGTAPEQNLVVAHYYLGIIEYSENAFAKAFQEFEWCLPRAETGQLPEPHLYKWLAKCATQLGMTRDAERYLELSKLE
jgi:tetratricopeptide (TPR) repeat protein